MELLPPLLPSASANVSQGAPDRGALLLRRSATSSGGILTCVRRLRVTGRLKFLACALGMAVTTFAGPQTNTAPSHPRPAPQISGIFIDTDGHRLMVQYRHDGQPNMFTGALQATCMLPGETKSTEGRP